MVICAGVVCKLSCLLHYPLYGYTSMLNDQRWPDSNRDTGDNGVPELFLLSAGIASALQLHLGNIL
jgi:hypothetical protein